MGIRPSDSVPGRVCCEPLFSVTCVTFCSPTVSIRARNARVGRFRTRGGEPKAESCGARLTRTLCCLFAELGAMVHASHIRERSDAAQGPASVDYLEARGWKLEAKGSQVQDRGCDLNGACKYLLRVRPRSGRPWPQQKLRSQLGYWRYACRAYFGARGQYRVVGARGTNIRGESH